MSRERCVLVHCFAGMNRSATVCAAWIVRSQRCPLDAAVKHIVTRRGYVLGNIGFVCGLVQMTRETGGFLSSRSNTWKAHRRKLQLAGREKADPKMDTQIAEVEQLRKKQARDLKRMKQQLAELEDAQEDKDWDAMTSEDESRLDIIAELRHKIAELEHVDG